MHVYEVDLVQSCILVIHSPNLPLVRPNKPDMLLKFLLQYKDTKCWYLLYLNIHGQNASCVTVLWLVYGIATYLI